MELTNRWPVTDPRGRGRPPTRRASAVVVWLTVVVGLCACPTTTTAEEDSPRARAPEGLVDVPGHLDPVRRTLECHRNTPRDVGHDGKLRDAWKEFLKRRAARMLRRVKDLSNKRVWVYEKQTPSARGLSPGAWSPVIRNASALHTELGVCAAGYRKTTVSPDRALWLWKRRFPGPEPIGPVPSAAALSEIERSIVELRIQGLPVPYSLLNARNRLRRQVWEEKERAREKARREYEEARRLATEAIQTRVEDTRRDLEGVASDLEESQALVRALLATAQQVEEDRLQQLVEEASEDPGFRTEAGALLARMARGRKAALGFSDTRLSRYGAQIQQQWMLPRGKLLKRIAKAETDSDAPD